MSLKLIFAIFLLSSAFSLPQPPQSESTFNSKLISDLQSIDSKIESYSPRGQGIKMRFSRLFEQQLANQQKQLELQDIQIMTSISLPYKDNMYYSMMLRKNGGFYTLRGDLIIGSQHKSLLVCSSWNDYTFFGEFDDQSFFVVRRLKVANRQFQLGQEVKLDFEGRKVKVNHFRVLSWMGQQIYVLVDNQKGWLLQFDRQGKLIDQIWTEGRILQIDHFNNKLIVLTQNHLMQLTLHRNNTRIFCTLPQISIQYFLAQDTHFGFIYAVAQGYVYQYELGESCRAVRSFHIPFNSTLRLTSHLLIVEVKGGHYSLNLSSGSLQPFSLPLERCQGTCKYSIIKKLSHQYIVSRICLNASKIEIAHVLLDCEEGMAEVTDFSVFRIPILLFSFGVIIYVTVNNRKRDTAAAAQDDSMFRQMLLGQLEALQHSEPNPQQRISSAQYRDKRCVPMEANLKLKAS